MFEYRVQKRTFGTKTEEVPEGKRKLCSEEIHNCILRLILLGRSNHTG
jgi:hypothetical protein